MAKIDIVTTALRRPELLQITYDSFFSQVSNLPAARIILNIDNIGEGSIDESIAIANRYSSDVVLRIGSQPNFSNAINWCWSQLSSPLFVHLEDDWFFRHKISFESWVSHLRSSKASQSVLVMKRRRPVNSLRYSFRPNLAWSREVAKIGWIPANVNPEKFVSGQSEILTSSDYGQDCRRYIEDTGRIWSKAQGLQKADEGGKWFVNRKSTLVTQWRYKLSVLRWSLLSIMQKEENYLGNLRRALKYFK